MKMKSMIEFLDAEPACNVSSVLAFRPEKLVYICDDAEKEGDNTRALKDFLNLCGVKNPRFEYADTENYAQMLGLIKRLTEQLGEDCAFDVSGGSEVALLAVGAFCASGGCIGCFHDFGSGDFRDVFTGEHLEGEDPVLDLDRILRLHGARRDGHNHFSASTADEQLRRIVEQISGIFFYKAGLWGNMVKYFQQASANNRSHYINAPHKLRGITAYDEVMRLLQECGAVKNYHRSREELEFEYTSQKARLCLTDAGSWLELYTLFAGMDTGYFESCDVSVIVDWNGRPQERGDVKNEIDCVFTRGLRSLFVSCKAKRSISTADINEICIQAAKFGGRNAVPVLVTTADDDTRHLINRAREMGVELIFLDEREPEALGRRLRSLI